MATGTGVVIVQAGDGIEPKQPPQVGARRIERASQALLEGRFNIAGKLEFAKPVDERLIEGI